MIIRINYKAKCKANVHYPTYFATVSRNRSILSCFPVRSLSSHTCSNLWRMSSYGSTRLQLALHNRFWFLKWRRNWIFVFIISVTPMNWINISLRRSKNVLFLFVHSLVCSQLRRWAKNIANKSREG